jgi:hypothetical protein
MTKGQNLYAARLAACSSANLTEEGVSRKGELNIKQDDLKPLSSMKSSYSLIRSTYLPEPS